MLALLVPLALALVPIPKLLEEEPWALAPLPIAVLLALSPVALEFGPIPIFLLLLPLALALGPQPKLSAEPVAVAPPPFCGSSPFVLPAQMNWPWAGNVNIQARTATIANVAIPEEMDIGFILGISFLRLAGNNSGRCFTLWQVSLDPGVAQTASTRPLPVLVHTMEVCVEQLLARVSSQASKPLSVRSAEDVPLIWLHCCAHRR